MLNIINEELMGYSTINTTEKGKDYAKIKVVTSTKLQQYENDARYNRNRTGDVNNKKDATTSSVKANITSKVDALKPINREIIRISAPLKTIAAFEGQPDESKSVEFDLPMSINVNSTNKYQPLVEVRCHEQGDDRANLYVVGVPFNGMIKPIPENPQYRIYKGLIASSAKPFFFNNRKYRKVLYLIIEVNKNLFNPDHKYHTDEVAITFESFALFDDRETGEKKTNCEKFTLRVTSGNGDYETEWDYKVADEAIMIAAEPGQQLWVTYDMSAHKNNAYHRNNNDDSRGNFRNNRKSQQKYTVEGDMMVTTNRHGIRKEIPMNRGRNQKNFRNNTSNKSKSIDQMMHDSGMFENEYNDSGSGRRNGGKRGNNRRKNRNYND